MCVRSTPVIETSTGCWVTRRTWSPSYSKIKRIASVCADWLISLMAPAPIFVGSIFRCNRQDFGICRQSSRATPDRPQVKDLIVVLASPPDKTTTRANNLASYSPKVVQRKEANRFLYLGATATTEWDQRTGTAAPPHRLSMVIARIHQSLAHRTSPCAISPEAADILKDTPCSIRYWKYASLSVR